VPMSQANNSLQEVARKFFSLEGTADQWGVADCTAIETQARQLA